MVAAAIKAAPVAPVVVKAAPVAQTVVSVSPSASASGLSGLDVAAGFGLGATPYLLIPALIFSSLKGLVKPAKPLPVAPIPAVTAGAYTKSLGAGLNEGIKELLSGRETADNELTKKGIKLSAAGFGSAIALSAVLVATTGSEVKEVKKVTTPTAVVKTVTAPKAAVVAAPKVVAPPAPKVIAAPTPKAIITPVAPKVDVAAAKKVADEKIEAEKALLKAAAEKTAMADAAEKIVAEKALLKAAAEKTAMADAAEKIVAERELTKAAAEKAAMADAAEKVSAEKALQAAAAEKSAADAKLAAAKVAEKVAAEEASAAASKKASEAAAAATVSAKAPVAVAAPTPAATTNSDGEEIYIAPVAVKGMEADKVDLSALKSLRVSTQFYMCTLFCFTTYPEIF